MFLLKLVLNDSSVQEILERVKKLEFTNDGVAVVETLCQDGGNSSFELLSSLLEFVEVVLEFSLFNVHDIVSDRGELILSIGEFFEDGLYGG